MILSSCDKRNERDCGGRYAAGLKTASASARLALARKTPSSAAVNAQFGSATTTLRLIRSADALFFLTGLN